MAVNEAQFGEAVTKNCMARGDEEDSHDADEDADAGLTRKTGSAMAPGPRTK